MIVRPLQYIALLILTLSSVRTQAPWPGTVPLAIRSPHFNFWLPSPGQQQWSTFWNDRNRILGWMGYIRIDGIIWEWLGPQGRSGNLTKTEITPTRTILTLVTGPMEVEVTFLSPIEPTDLVRQSFPFAYVYLTAKATDGANHSVQVYSDISAEWVSGDDNSEVTWSATPGDDLVFHQVQRASPESMQEINDQAEDATVYYAMANSSNVTWQAGSSPTIRNQFIGNLTTGGRLSNTEEVNFRAINKDWPVFSFSADFGNISIISTPVVWALGVIRDPVIRYGSGDGSTQQRSSFFWTQYNTIGDAIGAFVKDFPNALQRAVELDQKITSDALSISQDYADLVSLSARQTMGSIDITTSRGLNGQWNTSDVMIFMKSVGDTSRRANPTELMFAAFPAFLYLNASWAGFLLRPSLHQQAATPTSAYASPDLGSSYPSALGNNSIASAEALAIESSGNMIIMALAHAKASGDGSLISRYYTLLKSWANYLAANALNQTAFITSDGQNNPNLAIKGIIGIRAMGEISQILGQADDALRFKDQASTMLQEWENRTIISSHITSIYGQSGSWGLIYNLFSDRLLKLDFLNQTIYNDQTAFYAVQIPTAGKYGIAYDSNVPDQVKSHWTMLTAATMTDNSTRDKLVSMVRSRAWLNDRTAQSPTDYNAMSGLPIGTGGRSSPAHGAMLAFLALNLPDRIQAPAPGDVGGGNSKHDIGAIIGGTLSGVSVVGLVGLCLLLWKRHQKHKALAPASGLDPFPYSHISSTGDVHSSHPQRKGYEDPHGQRIGRPTATPNDSSASNILSQRLEPGLSSSRGTLTGNGTVSRDPETRALSPLQLNTPTTPGPIAPVRLLDPVPPQADVTRRLRDEMEILRSEMADILAQRAYDSDGAPPQYRTMATTISSHRD